METTLNFCGDSITFGLTHCTPEETYVAELARLLAEANPDRRVVRIDGNRPSGVLRVQEYEKILVSNGTEGTLTLVRNGVGGETVERAYERIDQLSGILANGREPSCTVLMYGINDASKKHPEKYVLPVVFKWQYRRLLRELKRRNPQVRLILMTPTVSEPSLGEYAQAVRELAQEEGLLCVDLHGFWAEHATEAWLNPPDICHPTPVAAKAMAQYIFSIINKKGL